MLKEIRDLGGDGLDDLAGSVAGFDLAAALRECDDLLVRHGGHASMITHMTRDTMRM